MDMLDCIRAWSIDVALCITVRCLGLNSLAILAVERTFILAICSLIGFRGTTQKANQKRGTTKTTPQQAKLKIKLQTPEVTKFNCWNIERNDKKKGNKQVTN